jgi:hypothetical protein
MGNYLPLIFGSGEVISGDATSGCACTRDHFLLLPVTSLLHTTPPQM